MTVQYKSEHFTRNCMFSWQREVRDLSVLITCACGITKQTVN